MSIQLLWSVGGGIGIDYFNRDVSKKQRATDSSLGRHFDWVHWEAFHRAVGPWGLFSKILWNRNWVWLTQGKGATLRIQH